MRTFTTLRLSATAALMLIALAAQAAEVDVRCEKRSNRSRASVDASNLDDGSYRAVLKSGRSRAVSGYLGADGDEAEFDFDSNPNDVAEGATRIASSFIVDGRVRAWVVDGSGRRVTPVVAAICRVRR